MANQGYIVIKNGDKDKATNYRAFYGPLDKGSSKPSFCYPKRKEALKEDVEKIERVLGQGQVAKEHEMELKVKLREKKTRLEQINQQEADAKKLFASNKDKCMERRNQLAEEIAAIMPSRDNVDKRRVNPHTVLRNEKTGLEDKKREFIVLSRLAGEESNISFLQNER
jgi:hypothetical protein